VVDKSIIWRKLDDLQLWGDNPNQGDVGAIIQSINRFGYNDAIAVWHDRVQGGNHRVMALHQLWQGGWRPSEKDNAVRLNGDGLEVATWDVNHLESEQEANAFGIALNRTTRLGLDDDTKLAALLQDIAAVDESLLTASGYDGDEIDDLMVSIRAIDDAGYLVDPVMQSKWGNVTTSESPKSDLQPEKTLLFERKPKARTIFATSGRAALDEIMPELPNKDTDYHIITIGRGKTVKNGDVVKTFGFGNFIDRIVDEFGGQCIVYISTWSLNRDHAFMLLELLESGGIAKLSMLYDYSLTSRKGEIAAILREGMKLFDNTRFVSCQNHSKVYCFKNSNASRFCTVVGSSNLSGLPRAENYVISTSPELYHEYVNKFFEPMLQSEYPISPKYKNG
jgi:hypothetical protein